MSARSRVAGSPHTFRLRGAAVTFRATRIGAAVRVETIGLDDQANGEASAALSRALIASGFEVFPLSPAAQCRRLEVYGADQDRVRQEFTNTIQSLTGGAA